MSHTGTDDGYRGVVVACGGGPGVAGGVGGQRSVEAEEAAQAL